jgi:hypothetical protein
VDWIHLGQDRGQWWVLVNMLWTHEFHKRWNVFRSWETISSSRTLPHVVSYFKSCKLRIMTHMEGDALQGRIIRKKVKVWSMRKTAHTRCENLTGMYEGVSRSFWTGRLEQELQMVQLSATRCCCITIF